MKRVPKNLITLGLVVFFAFGIWCAALVAPGQSLASVSGCSQNGRAMEMSGCQHPSYLCGFDASSNIFFQGVRSSALPDDSFKNYLSVAIGEAYIVSSNSEASLIGRECRSAFPAGSHKVSIRLFNSILNL